MTDSLIYSSTEDWFVERLEGDSEWSSWAGSVDSRLWLQSQLRYLCSSTTTTILFLETQVFFTESMPMAFPTNWSIYSLWVFFPWKTCSVNHRTVILPEETFVTTLLLGEENVASSCLSFINQTLQKKKCQTCSISSWYSWYTIVQHRYRWQTEGTSVWRKLLVTRESFMTTAFLFFDTVSLTFDFTEGRVGLDVRQVPSRGQRHRFSDIDEKFDRKYTSTAPSILDLDLWTRSLENICYNESLSCSSSSRSDAFFFSSFHVINNKKHKFNSNANSDADHDSSSRNQSKYSCCCHDNCFQEQLEQRRASLWWDKLSFLFLSKRN